MDPPGDTIYLYLQQANRRELQKQAKEHGIKANQKTEVLRAELKSVLTSLLEEDKYKAVIEEPIEQELETVIDDSKPQSEETQIVVEQLQDTENVFVAAPAPKAETESHSPNPESVDIETTVIKDRKPLSEKTMNSMTSRIPGVLSKNEPKTKLLSVSTTEIEARPSKSSLKTPVKNVNQIIRKKNASPTSAPSISSSTVLASQSNKTQQRRRMKQMPMSRRNEEQYQKFLQRQSQGRKAREERLRRDAFAHLVR